MFSEEAGRNPHFSFLIPQAEVAPAGSLNPTA
jgi:hypothetical protein